MANKIKTSGGGAALQVTKPARDAGLVEENADGDPTRLAEVLVYGFDGLLIVVDAPRVSAEDRAELVAAAARDTGSIHRGEPASVEIAGHGYQVQLPGCRAAGFEQGDDGVVNAGDSVLLISDGSADGRRLVEDLRTLRTEQVSR